MPLYTFYPYRSGGARLTFELAELQDDARALVHAERVLLGHPSCVGVEVYQDERSVGAYMNSGEDVGDRAEAHLGDQHA